MSKNMRAATAPAAILELVDYYARVAKPSHPEAGRLLAYWQGCIAKGGGFVIGRDIPAKPVASLLRSIILNEPLADGSDMKVRLAGAMIRRRFGGDIKGHLLSELFSPDDFESHLASSFEAVRTGRPVILDSSLKRGAVEELHVEVVLLPVTARDLISPWLLVGMFYFD